MGSILLLKFRLALILPCLLVVTTAFAVAEESVQVLESALLEALIEPQTDEVEQYFSSLYDVLKTTTQAEYVPVLASISDVLRTNRLVSATQSLVSVIQAKDIQPETTQFHYYLMMTLSYDLMALTQFAQARDFIKPQLQAISNWQPETDDARSVQANLFHIYGQLLVRQSRVSEALSYFYQAEDWFTAISPNHPSIFVIQVILGEAFLKAKDYQRAEQFLQKALTMVPEGRVDGLSYVNALLASAMERQQSPERAIEVIDRYLENAVDPRKDYFLYFSIVHVEVLRSLERYSEALMVAEKTYELAKELANEDYLKDVRRHIGYLHSRLGDLQAAQQWLYESLYSPGNIRELNNPQVYLDYVDVLEQLGDYETALAYHRRYHRAFIEELEQINQLAIAALEQDRENSKLAQEKEVATIELELATANENRARLQSVISVWVTAFFALLALTVSFFVVQLRRKNALLLQMAIEDQLTQKGNRRAFVESLADDQYTTMVIADIDGLKLYNDRYGHQRGDELIQAFAKALERQLEGLAGQVFRIGGDEFAILSQRATVHDIDGWLSNAVEELHQRGFEYADASYGYAHRSEIDSSGDWTALADMRMYEMKSQRRTKRMKN